MKRMKASVLDERELQEMRRIEHGGLWAMYALLCGAMVVQMFMGAALSQIAGELIVFAAVSLGMIVAYARRGLWDEHARPSVRGNAVYALCSGVAVAVIVAALRSSLLMGLASGAAMSALCFGVLSLMMAYVRRRQSEQEDALEDEETDS